MPRPPSYIKWTLQGSEPAGRLHTRRYSVESDPRLREAEICRWGTVNAGTCFESATPLKASAALREGGRAAEMLVSSAHEPKASAICTVTVSDKCERTQKGPFIGWGGGRHFFMALHAVISIVTFHRCPQSF